MTVTLDEFMKDCTHQERTKAAARTAELVEDQRALAEAILNPPEPTPALLRAAEANRRLIRE
jgi:hypothetical protein